MRFILTSALVATSSALVVNSPAAAPQRSTAVRTSSISMAGKGVDDKYFTGLRAKTAEEKRRLRIMDGANWRPRTYPKEGEGYFFFQGPTPKTSVQKDVPSFFSAENFADLQISTKQLAVTATGFASFFVVASTLLAPTGDVMPAKAPVAVVSIPGEPSADELRAILKASTKVKKY